VRFQIFAIKFSHIHRVRSPCLTSNDDRAYTTHCLQADPCRTERRSSGFTFPNKTKGLCISVRDKRFYNKDYAHYRTSNPYNSTDKELSCLHYTLTLAVK